MGYERVDCRQLMDVSQTGRHPPSPHPHSDIRTYFNCHRVTEKNSISVKLQKVEGLQLIVMNSFPFSYNCCTPPIMHLMSDGFV